MGSFYDSRFPHRNQEPHPTKKFAAHPPTCRAETSGEGGAAILSKPFYVHSQLKPNIYKATLLKYSKNSYIKANQGYSEKNIFKFFPVIFFIYLEFKAISAPKKTSILPRFSRNVRRFLLHLLLNLSSQYRSVVSQNCMAAIHGMVEC